MFRQLIPKQGTFDITYLLIFFQMNTAKVQLILHSRKARQKSSQITLLAIPLKVQRWFKVRIVIA